MFPSILLSAMFILFSSGSVQAADDFIQLKSNNGIEFDYRIHDGVMDARIICDTTGWVSAGFDPTDQMAGANIIIGYIDVEGKPQIRDDYGTDKTHHKADVDLGGTSDVGNVAGAEAVGFTRLDFTIPLETKDPNDKPLKAGVPHTLILGCGKDGFKNFVTIHKKVAALPFTF